MYRRPSSIEEAVGELGAAPEDSKLLAGGQSLVPLMNFRLAAPRVLIDLNRIDGLSYVRPDGDRLRVGALTRVRTVEHSSESSEALPVLAHAVHWVGHVQIRSRGTVGGSVAHADPAAELPAICLLTDAQMRLVGPAGERTVEAASFFHGFLSTEIRPEEMLVEVAFRCFSPAAKWGFSEFAQRRGDFAAAGAACVLDKGAGQDSRRLVVFGAADRPVRCRGAEEVLAEDGDAEDLARAAAAKAAEDVGHHHSSGSGGSSDHAYLVEPVVTRALLQALRG